MHKLAAVVVFDSSCEVIGKHKKFLVLDKLSFDNLIIIENQGD